jgi:acyl-CoA synthetase (NDP forming)
MSVTDEVRAGRQPATRDSVSRGLAALMRPKSVAIVGASSKPESPTHTVLKNLRANDYRGVIHLVSRSGGEIDGHRCLTSVAELPRDVDLAILMVNASAVREVVGQCGTAGVRSAVCFASGFAEMGDEGRREQEAIASAADASGLTLIGPNCVGYFNYVDRFCVMLVEMGALRQLSPGSPPGVAIVAQSGGIGAHLAASLMARDVPVSYMMTTGNEASTGLADLVHFYVTDSRSRVIVVYAEQVRRPAELKEAVRLARAAGKFVLLLHPGRSVSAQAAAASHTGALAGDHAVMRIALEESGVIVVDTLEELIDLAEVLSGFDLPRAPGLGVVTASGALCAILQDYAESLGAVIPAMADAQADTLRAHLPHYTPPRNPLDLGTLAAWKPDLLRLGTEAMLGDPDIGSVLVSFPYGEPSLSVPWIKALAAASARSRKPVVYVVHDEGVALPPEVVRIARENRLILCRSPERAMRALASLSRMVALNTAAASRPHMEPADLPQLVEGAQPEWLGKRVLSAIGVCVPQGRLAHSVDEAIAVARGAGYPVVLKAQAASLTHKSDVGGVILNVRDEASLRDAWARLHSNVSRAAPGASLDGVLVEAMVPGGIELVIGAKRDPAWGTFLMVGLGGVWIEALKDVALLPADASHDRILAALKKLRGSRLLGGFRGAPPADLDAIAAAAACVGRLMLQHEELIEIDVNPFVAFTPGNGGMALDALVITRAARP